MNALVGFPQIQRPCLRFAPAQRCPKSDPPFPKHQGKWRRLFLGGFLLLAGYALFCHGCHGDEDNELFASRLAAPLTAAAVAGDASGNRSTDELLGHVQN